jgi:hypothetical protein
MGHSFMVRITPFGYEVQRDPRELARELPTSAGEDEDAAASVAADALRETILSVQDLLDKREWTGAARELQEGDQQYRDGHWTDAVREYTGRWRAGSSIGWTRPAWSTPQVQPSTCWRDWRQITT